MESEVVMIFRSEAPRFQPQIGDRVRIRNSRRSPYSGRVGTIVTADRSNGNATFMVKFEDGLQFRYKVTEFTATEPPPSELFVPS
jgi:hypothetical protein